MRNLTMPIIMTLALLPVSANAMELGVYYCVIERMVGVQSEDSSDDRFAGAINPDPERFVLKISEHSPETDELCKIQDMQWLPSCDPSAAYRAEFPDGRVMTEPNLYSSDRSASEGAVFHGVNSMFWIGKERFLMVELVHGHGAGYLSEGTCQRFQQHDAVPQRAAPGIEADQHR